MKWLASPEGFQALGALLLAMGIVGFGILVVWKLRKDTAGAISTTPVRTAAESAAFASAAFQGVIADLKERERALQSQISEEARQMALFLTMHRAVLENIGTGVLQISSGLLVQQANPAARKLLGYASPLGMHVRDVFRGLQNIDLPSDDGALGGIAQAVREVSASGSEYRNVSASYCAPSGEERALRFALLPILDPAQRVTSVLCLVELA